MCVVLERCVGSSGHQCLRYGSKSNLYDGFGDGGVGCSPGEVVGAEGVLRQV